MISRERLIELLDELGARLSSRGINARIYIVGGAAMALAYDRERLTRDVDAVYVPKAEVYAEAEKMAAEHDDIDSGWLNDAMKAFLSATPDEEARIISEHPGLTVEVASPRKLLAMKVYAARADRDSDDLLRLAKEVNARSIEEVLDIADHEYGALLQAKSRFLVIELLQDHLPMQVPSPHGGNHQHRAD